MSSNTEKNKTLPAGWREVKLGEIMEFKNGLNTKKENYGSGIKFINVMDIFGKNYLFSNNVIGSVQASKKQISDYSVKYGDILFNRTSETFEDIAISSVYFDQKEVIFGGFVIRGRQKFNTFVPEYSIYCFQSQNVRKELIRRGQGAIRANIGQKDLSEIPIVVPPLREQKAIASLLETWDTAIEKTEALIAAKEKRFKWLQYKLFSDVSSRSALSEVANISQKDKITSIESAKLLKVKLHCKGIEENTRDVNITLSEKGRPYYVRNSGEFLIGRQNFHNGGFGIVPMELDGFVASNAITSLDLDESTIKLEFLFYYFSRKSYYLHIASRMDGTGQKELSDKQIMKLPISVPPMEEQARVVYILNKIQKEIDLLKKLAKSYRTQKRGLMQKLLVGRWCFNIRKRL